MPEPDIATMARAVARELEDEGRWTRLVMFNGEQCCARGHAQRLFGRRGETLLCDAYLSRFTDSCLTHDNDAPERGRLFVRARLLELADAHEAEARGEGRDGK